MQDDPFTGPAPREVPLESTPLVWVIAQVQFPPILSVVRPDFIAPFQESIREIYSDTEQTGVIVDPRQPPSAAHPTGWKFRDTDNKWQITVAPDFLALITGAYESRSDFIERLQFILEKFDEHININGVSIHRFGLRYIDRITGDTFDKLKGIVRPEMMGIMGTPTARHIEQSLNQTLFKLPGDGEEKLQARWGKMPAGATFDPALVKPVGDPSWILDTDMFSTKRRPFNPDQLISDVRHYAEITYRFFRWAVTDEFLCHHGGKP